MQLLQVAMSGDISWKFSAVSVLFVIIKSEKSSDGIFSYFIFSIRAGGGFKAFICKIKLFNSSLLLIFNITDIPSVVLVTVPEILFFSASLYINGLKPTPCTIPEMLIL